LPICISFADSRPQDEYAYLRLVSGGYCHVKPAKVRAGVYALLSSESDFSPILDLGAMRLNRRADRGSSLVVRVHAGRWSVPKKNKRDADKSQKRIAADLGAAIVAIKSIVTLVLAVATRLRHCKAISRLDRTVAALDAYAVDS
jgi:hypothetical protein